MVVQHRHPLFFRARLVLLAFLLAPLPLPAENIPLTGIEPGTDSLWQLPSTAVQSATSRTPRLRLFRIAPAFSAEPLGLYEAEDILGKTSKAELEPGPADDGPDWLQVAMGADNPYLDFRQPGDPGGLGFYRIYTQVRIFETAHSACALCLQTVTPSGIQYWGLPDGATVCSPSLSIYKSLDGGLALQGFLSKNVAVCDAAVDRGLQRRVEGGLGLQQPLTRDGLFLSMEGLVQTPADHRALDMPPSMQVLPGMQWQLDEAWWLSSGVLVPVGPLHHRPGQWQMTCSFQF